MSFARMGSRRGGFVKQGLAWGVLLVSLTRSTSAEDLAAISAAGQVPKQFFVSTTGSNDNDGTRERPFATIERARDAVRGLIQQGLKQNVEVLLLGGTYDLSSTVEFGPADSGTAEHSISYMAFPGETPILSGARRIAKVRLDGEQWVADISGGLLDDWRGDQLFVAGQRRPRAAAPNAGFLRVQTAGADNRTSFQFAPGSIPALRRPADAQLLFLHDWSVSRVEIATLDSDRGILAVSQPIGAANSPWFNITGFEPHPRFRVEGVVELLDAPGEWCVDREQHVLRYLPLEGEEPQQTEICVPTLETLLLVRSDLAAERRVQNLRFVGLTLAYAAAPRFFHNYAGTQAGFHPVRQLADESDRPGRMPAAVVFDATSHCRLESCCVVHVGGTAISLQGPADSNVVAGNVIADVGGNGIMVGEPSTSPSTLAQHNVVSNNDIRHCGELFLGCVGVWVGITAGTSVEHNAIHHLPYSGVSVGWVWEPTPSPCRDNRIANNHIHHVMQVLSDGGGIYTLGRQEGTVLRNNLIHDVPLNAGRAESNGLFIDEGSSEILIEGNVIYGTARSPIRFHRASRDVIRANVLVPPDGTPVFRFNNTDETSLTFDGNSTPALSGWIPPTAEEVDAGISPPLERRAKCVD